MNTAIEELEIPDKIRSKISDRDWVDKQLKKGKSGQELLGLSEETMNACYAIGCFLIEQEQFRQAADAFLFLSALNSYEYRYWLGLGASLQFYGDYEGAINAHEMAAMCRLDSPTPYFHLAKCLFEMHDKESAVQALDLAIEYSEGRSEYEELHQQAIAAKDFLLKGES